MIETRKSKFENESGNSHGSLSGRDRGRGFRVSSFEFLISKEGDTYAQAKGRIAHFLGRAQVRPRAAERNELGLSEQVSSPVGGDGRVRGGGGRGDRLASQRGEARRSPARPSGRGGHHTQLRRLVLPAPDADRHRVRARSLPDVLQHQSALSGHGGDAGGGRRHGPGGPHPFPRAGRYRRR